MTGRYLPNLISAARIVLVVPVVWLLGREQYIGALVVFALAGLSDGLDGLLAKRYGWLTRFGGMLDAVADKILLVSTFVSLGWIGLIPLWLVAAAVLRDAIILAGGVAYQVGIEPLEPAPSFISKLNTLLQILLVLAVLWHHGVLALPADWLPVLFYTVLATTVLSGLDYVWTWGLRAWQLKRGGTR